MKNDIATQYSEAITGGIKDKIAAILSPAVKVYPPGSNSPNEGQGKASMMLSAVASVVSDFTAVRVYDGGNGWHSILLQGDIDGTPVQFIDQIHVNDESVVDHVDIFLRPATLAERLLAEVTIEIQKRQIR